MTTPHDTCPRCDGPKQTISKLCQHCHGELWGRRMIQRMQAAGVPARVSPNRKARAERRYAAQFDEPSLPQFKCLKDVK